MREILWRDGRFVRRDGSTFWASGGVFAEIVFPERCGIIRPEDKLHRDDDDGRSWLWHWECTDDELRQWLRYLRAEGMNYVRYFCLSARRLRDEPLDVGGKLNPVRWRQLLRYMDLAAEEGIYFHLVICPEPRTTVYFKEGSLQKYALQYWTLQEIAGLSAQHRAILDPATPRIGYDRYFCDPTVLQCQFDLIEQMASDVRDHPALLCAEVYNEQQWDNDQFGKGRCFLWEVHDEEMAWTARIVSKIQAEFPGLPVCVSFAGLGFTAQDPFTWIDHVPMDFYSPHLYQALAGIPMQLDYGGVADVVLLYQQAEKPTMMGEFDPSDFREGMGTERLLVRDMAWFAALNGCPGFGMWTARGWNEFAPVCEMMERIGFASLDLAPPEITVDIIRQVAEFARIEAEADPTCGLPGDYWCPHRPEDSRHIYCQKFTSRAMEELWSWAYFALTNGLRYSLCRRPQALDPGATSLLWDPRDIGPAGLEQLPRCFVPPPGYQLKYLSSADGALHVAYLRNYQYYRLGVNSGRRKTEPRDAALQLALPPGEYSVEVWNLDTGGRTRATCRHDATMGLRRTNDDFAVMFTRH